MEGSPIFLHLLIGPLMLVISLIFFYFPPKKINHVYGHRTTLSMKNQDTWNEANKRSTHMMLLVSALTCILQLIGIVFNIDVDTTILYATIFLVAGLVIGVLVIEKQLKTIFDKDGNRKMQL
ncbi:MAG: SdpI family protein [Flavobacteriales bacterium]|nr:SdpI family protein [Flavobacteriales bacterium]